MRQSLLYVLLLALSCGVLHAQDCVYTAQQGVPSTAASSTLATTSNGYKRRQQVLVPSYLFENVPTLITDFAHSIGQTYSRKRFDRLTIRFGHTSVTTLSTTFANNITGPMQTVLLAENHVHTEALTGPAPGWVPVGMQQPFLFLPGSGNLLIDVLIENGTSLASASSGGQGGYSSIHGDTIVSNDLPTVPTTGNQAGRPGLRFCVDRAEKLLFGESCAGSGGSTPLLGLGSRPILGTSVTIWLSDAPPNAMAACAFGFETRPPFPIDLTSQGAPGCRQYFQEGALVFLTANPLGIGQLALPIPSSPSVVGAVVYTQYYVLDPTGNALGITSSNYGSLLVGL